MVTERIDQTPESTIIYTGQRVAEEMHSAAEFPELAIMTPFLQEAGRAVMKHWRQESLQVEQKDHAGDVVTEADRESEQILRKAIRAKFGINAWIYMEEGGVEEGAEGQHEIWTVDGIDGTSAYSNGLDQFAISVGRIIAGQPTAGFIILPRTGEIIAGKPGVGIFINGQWIGLTESKQNVQLKEITGQINHELVSQESSNEQPSKVLELFFGSDRMENGRRIKTRHIRLPLVVSSSAYGIAHMGMGRLHLAMHPNQAYQDVVPMAAVVMAKGGQITTFDGKPLNFNLGARSDVLATWGIDRKELTPFLPQAAA